eukprot:366278-Chlamydomonas_euryale.AAC.18
MKVGSEHHALPSTLGVAAPPTVSRSTVHFMPPQLSPVSCTSANDAARPAMRAGMEMWERRPVVRDRERDEINVGSQASAPAAPLPK